MGDVQYFEVHVAVGDGRFRFRNFLHEAQKPLLQLLGVPGTEVHGEFSQNVELDLAVAKLQIEPPCPHVVRQFLFGKIRRDNMIYIIDQDLEVIPMS